MTDQPTPTESQPCSVIGCSNEGSRHELGSGAWTIICEAHYQQLYGEGAITLSYPQGNDQAQQPLIDYNQLLPHFYIDKGTGVCDACGLSRSNELHEQQQPQSHVHEYCFHTNTKVILGDWRECLDCGSQHSELWFMGWEARGVADATVVKQ